MRASPLPETRAIWRAAALFGAVAFPLSLTSCGTSRGTVSTSYTTSLRVDPQEFITEQECISGSSGLQRYVATLIDLSPTPGTDSGVHRLASSPPTSCLSAVEFGEVVYASGLYPAHRYMAAIQGYSETELEPVEFGSPIMVSSVGKEPNQIVQPTFVGYCGAPPDFEPPELEAEANNAPPANDSGAQLPSAQLPDGGQNVPSDAGTDAGTDANLDAGRLDSAADAGRLDEVDAAAEGDAGQFDWSEASSFGPVFPVFGRRLTLHGCVLRRLAP